MTDTVTVDKKHLDEVLGDEEYGYEDAPPQISYTVSQALEKIAAVSDNYAAIMLAERISWDRVRSFTRKLGVVDTTIKAPYHQQQQMISLFFSVSFYY